MTAQNTKQKLGYKQTEVGVIPVDWEVKTLGEIASVGSGGTPDRLNPTYWDGDVPWVTTTQINFNLIDKANEFITRNGLEKSAARVYNPGTLLMAMYGQGKTRGKVAILAISAAINQACAAINLNKGISSKYVFFNLSARYEEIRSLSNTGNQENLNSTIIKNILLPLPKEEKEQRTISDVLSDVDALIASLDRLIAKKRDIKQATMQQLLTGKTRLPGFTEQLKPAYKQTEVGVIPVDWEVHTLGDELDHLEAGISVNSVNEDFHIYAHEQAILKTSAVFNGYFLPHENKKIAPRDINRAKLSPRVDSIIISRMNTIDLVGECGYVDKDYSNLYLPDRLWMMRFKRKSKVNVKWLSYVLSYKKYKANIKLAATGTSGSMKNISKDSLLSINIPFPAPEEQQSIAAVLIDMDAEIVALEQKRDKTRALKQGMMQELLTGKTRLL